MEISVRKIMDSNFTTCFPWETVAAATQKLINDHASCAIVVDEDNTYHGILTAIDLLKTHDVKKRVEQVMQTIPPISEDDTFQDIHLDNSDVFPVVNRRNIVLGIINLRSAFPQLADLMPSQDPERSLKVRRPSQTNAKYSINDIAGQSKPILLMKEQILAAAKTKSTIMLLGETGTGKELVAHSIHRLSNRRHNAFIRINCAAIPDNLLESELFGYDSGAFTGAAKGGQIGKFEMADGGTIFLDEIGDMPMPLQSKILRVLQEKEIEKVGGRAPIPVDVRVIAATHRNLLQLVTERKFREDLYYRLHVIPIQLPPLRDRREDIPLLVDFFLTKHSLEMDIEKPLIERECLMSLIGYDWPGNVRELFNILEMAISMSSGAITQSMLPSPLKSERAVEMDEPSPVLRNLSDNVEKAAILQALEDYDGNKSKVCEVLRISRSSLYSKLKKYQIDV
jgi:transcriptional regulator with PAS, ATPase and Fis domain